MIGLFVSFNSSGREGAAGKIRGALHKAFAARYLPGTPHEGQVDEATAREHAAQMAGLYDSSRRPDDNFLAILNLVGQTKVVPTEDGSISVPALTGLDGLPVKWREIAPYVWRDVNGSDRLAAKVVDGKVVRWSFEPVSPFTVMEPVPEMDGVTVSPAAATKPLPSPRSFMTVTVKVCGSVMALVSSAAMAILASTQVLVAVPLLLPVPSVETVIDSVSIVTVAEAPTVD